ncbi:hypothetical protein BDZ97DRAFT_1759879 [Flammula alnicola]|nr:hypothetical protein BDZ97DRAFT_1759879 [Flammula alnicola]
MCDDTYSNKSWCIVLKACSPSARSTSIVIIDCRGISESLVKELSPMTRPRLGWRAYGARKLMYLDARDDNEEDLKLGQDECDESRVVLKTLYSWQIVDAVQAGKEKRRKTMSRWTASDLSTGVSNLSTGASDQKGVMIGCSARRWSPGGRRATVGTIGLGIGVK